VFSILGKPSSLSIVNHTYYLSLTLDALKFPKLKTTYCGSVFFQLLVFLEYLAYSRRGLVSGKCFAMIYCGIGPSLVFSMDTQLLITSFSGIWVCVRAFFGAAGERNSFSSYFTLFDISLCCTIVGFLP